MNIQAHQFTPPTIANRSVWPGYVEIGNPDEFQVRHQHPRVKNHYNGVKVLSERNVVQAELNDFYKARLAQLQPLLDQRHRDNLSAPLLLSVPDAYFNAQVRIMFVGKETNGWWGKLWSYYAVDGAFDALIAHYDKKILKPRFTGRFLQMMRRTAHELAGGRVDAIAWSNVFRMDHQQGKKSCRNSKGFSELLTVFSRDMLLHEVKLLKPDVILFASGTSYDDVLKEYFPERSESERIVPRALWKFKAEDVVCYRLQHPQTRPRKNSTFKPVEDYYAMAFALIKERFKDRYLLQPPVLAGDNIEPVG